MAVSPEIRKLAQQALKIRNSHVPLHRVIDVLAMEEGDISTVLNRFRDIKNDDLRRALHNCAVLLRQIEQETGLAPAWDQGSKSATASSSAAKPPASSGQSVQSAPAKEKPKKAKFRPEELLDFEDDASRGQVRMAKVYVDGASKGNPGDAGIGVAMFSMEGKKIAQLARAIGQATNNIAEYTALTEALQLAQRMGVKVLHVISDSELMVKQMNGQYKIKNPDILKKAQEAQGLKKTFERFNINYVGRDHNQLADALSTSLLKRKAADDALSAADEPGSEDVMGSMDDVADEGSTE